MSVFKKEEQPVNDESGDPLATLKQDLEGLPVSKQMSSLGASYFLSSNATPLYWPYPMTPPQPMLLEAAVSYVMQALALSGLNGPTPERHVETLTADGYRVSATIRIEKEPAE